METCWFIFKIEGKKFTACELSGFQTLVSYMNITAIYICILTVHKNKFILHFNLHVVGLRLNLHIILWDLIDDHASGTTKLSFLAWARTTTQVKAWYGGRIRKRECSSHCPLFVSEERSSTGSYRLDPATGTPGSSAVFMIFYATLTVEMICYDRSLKKCTPEL